MCKCTINIMLLFSSIHINTLFFFCCFFITWSSHYPT